MEWDPPETTPVGEGLAEPVEQPVEVDGDHSTIPTVFTVPAQIHTEAIPVEPAPKRPNDRADRTSADDDDDAYRGRPRWVLPVAIVLIVTFVGWAIVTTASNL